MDGLGLLQDSLVVEFLASAKYQRTLETFLKCALIEFIHDFLASDLALGQHGVEVYDARVVGK